MWRVQIRIMKVWLGFPYEMDHPSQWISTPLDALVLWLKPNTNHLFLAIPKANPKDSCFISAFFATSININQLGSSPFTQQFLTNFTT